MSEIMSTLLKLNVSPTTTESGSHSESYSEPRWIAGEIMLLLIAIVTIYIFASLIYYSWRFRNMARVSGSGHEMRERYLHYSCAAVILIAIARCILHQILVFMSKDEIEECRIIMTTSRIVYNLAICLTYVHLWLRQRMFYTRDDIKHLRGKAIEVVDWLVLVLIVAISLILALIAFIPLNDEEIHQQKINKERCNVFDYSSKMFVNLYAGLAIFFQFALIMLYLYPIILQKIMKRRNKRKTAKPGASPAMSVTPELWSGIRRGFILTIVVIISDACAAILVWYLNKQYPLYFSSIIAINDVNLIMNVVCCICTFRNWRKIVFGFPICRKFGWEKDAILRLKKPHTSKRAGSQEIHENDLERANNNDSEYSAMEEKHNILNESLP